MIEALAHNRAFLREHEISLVSFGCASDRDFYDLVVRYQVQTFQIDRDLEGSNRMGFLTREIAFSLLGRPPALIERPYLLVDLDDHHPNFPGKRLVLLREGQRPPRASWILDTQDLPRRAPAETVGFYLRGPKRLHEAKQAEGILKNPIALLEPKALRVLQRGELERSQLVLLTTNLPTAINWSFVSRRAVELRQGICICPTLSPHVRQDRVEEFRRRLDRAKVETEFWQLAERCRLIEGFPERLGGALWQKGPPVALTEEPVEPAALPALKDKPRAPSKGWSEDRRRRFMALRKLTKRPP